MQNVIDLAAERTQRELLAQQASEGTDAFVAGLQRAGQTLANFAWVLAAPVRHRDKELREGIYALILARLSRIIAGSFESPEVSPEFGQQALKHAENIAFSSFQTQLLTLAAAEQDGKATT